VRKELNALRIAQSGVLRNSAQGRWLRVAGLVLVWFGGFRLFERLMSLCIGLMFAAVMLTAFMVRPDLSALVGGLTQPSIPKGGTGWVLGILGGVGGTVTLLSYGYWIRERGREGLTGVRACRFDLGIGYAMTALFGVAMILIGSRVHLAGKGASVATALAGQLSAAVGPAGKWVFLVGFWGAVFSSLLGVWQGVPYLFADFLALRKGMTAEDRRNIDYTRTPAYRGYLLALALVPLPVLWISVTRAQLAYAVLGSLFMPLLALTLLIMNNQRRWVGDRFRSGWITNAVLVITLLFFAYVGADQAVRSVR
ncbi:MAG: divalent metal cation transporter, partial [bacterium]|nr:divalent metal cation transporter [bacterium]